jgi:hypothetical protein
LGFSLGPKASGNAPLSRIPGSNDRRRRTSGWIAPGVGAAAAGAEANNRLMTIVA